VSYHRVLQAILTSRLAISIRKAVIRPPLKFLFSFFRQFYSRLKARPYVDYNATEYNIGDGIVEASSQCSTYTCARNEVQFARFCVLEGGGVGWHGYGLLITLGSRLPSDCANRPVA